MKGKHIVDRVPIKAMYDMVCPDRASSGKIIEERAWKARKLSSECQRARHDMVCNNRAWRGKMVGDRAWKGGAIVAAGQKGPAGSTVTPGETAFLH